MPLTQSKPELVTTKKLCQGAVTGAERTRDLPVSRKLKKSEKGRPVVPVGRSKKPPGRTFRKLTGLQKGLVNQGKYCLPRDHRKKKSTNYQILRMLRN